MKIKGWVSSSGNLAAIRGSVEKGGGRNGRDRETPALSARIRTILDNPERGMEWRFANFKEPGEGRGPNMSDQQRR